MPYNEPPELEEALGFRIPVHWDRRNVRNLEGPSKPEYDVRVEEAVAVPARNGETIVVGVFRPDADHPSHLVLPIIPDSAAESWVPPL